MESLPALELKLAQLELHLSIDEAGELCVASPKSLNDSDGAWIRSHFAELFAMASAMRCPNCAEAARKADDTSGLDAFVLSLRAQASETERAQWKLCAEHRLQAKPEDESMERFALRSEASFKGDLAFPGGA